MSDILLLFLTNTFIYSDALRRVRVLDEYLDVQIFKGNKDLLSRFSSDDSMWLESLSKDFLKSFSKDNLSTNIEQLKKGLQEISPLIIYIPVDLPKTDKISIAQKVRSNYGPNFLVDFKLDPTLIAGCALIWQGRYKDISLRKKIEDQKESILTVLRNYIK